MKVSGSGKTAKILALGTKIHLIYLSATDSISDVDKFTDTSFRNFAENLSLLLAKGWADLLLNVKQEILLFFFARFLHLYILAEHYCKRNKELTPLEFMKHQFNGGLDLIKRIYIQIRSKCIMYSENDLRQLIEETIRKLTETHKIEKIGFVLDEASVAAILFTKNPPLISRYGQQRGLLTLLIEEILRFGDRLHHFSFAGTALTLHKIGRIGSAVGKAGDIRHVFRLNGVKVNFEVIEFKNDSMQLKDVSMVQKFIETHINFKGCEGADQYLQKLIGRRRNSTRLIFEISTCMKDANSSKLEVLKKCCENTFIYMVDELYDNIKRYCCDTGVQKALKDFFVYSAFFQDTDQVFSTSVDMLELAVCDFECIEIEKDVQKHPAVPSSNQNVQPDNSSSSQEKVIYKNYILKEKIAIQALINFARYSKWDKEALVLESAIESFERSIKASEIGAKSNEKGKMFEILCFANLFASYKDKVIASYNIKLVPEDNKKGWMKKINFIVKGFGSAEKLFEITFEDYFKNVVTLLKDQNNDKLDKYLNYIVMPPNQIHPDGIWITKTEGKLYFILFSCKCYTLSLDVRSSHCSTMIDRLYLDHYTENDPFNVKDKNGKIKQNRGRARWKKFIKAFSLEKGKEKKSIINGVLRIHIHAATQYQEYSQQIPPLKDITLPPTTSIDIDLKSLKNILDQKSYNIVVSILISSL